MEKYRDIVELFVKNVSLECATEKPSKGRGRGRGKAKIEEEELPPKWKSKEEEANDIDGEAIYVPPPSKKGRTAAAPIDES